jgi:hypothetical protein
MNPCCYQTLKDIASSKKIITYFNPMPKTINNKEKQTYIKITSKVERRMKGKCRLIPITKITSIKVKMKYRNHTLMMQKTNPIRIHRVSNKKERALWK